MCPKFCVEATELLKRTMRAIFDDGATVEYNNAIHLLNRTEAMSNNESGTSLHELLKRFLDVEFAFTIKRTCGLVQDEYWRVFQNGSCYCHALALAATELDAALANDSVVTFR